jgi:hypothetical protein
MEDKEIIFHSIGHELIQFINLTSDFITIDTLYKDNKMFNSILPGKYLKDLLNFSLNDISLMPMITKPED